MTDARDHDHPRRIEADLARERDELALALAALRERLRRPAEPARNGFAATAAPVAKAAVRAAQTWPLASAVAGAGLAWLGWRAVNGLRGKDADSAPEWLVEAGELHDRAAKLRARIEEAAAAGGLDEAGARDSLAEVDEALKKEVRRLMGRGLDGLEAEARAAALAAREEVWQAKYGGGRPKIAALLTSGPVLALAGAALAAVIPRASAAKDTEQAARDAVEAARQVIGEEADRLTALAEELSRSLREALDAAKTGDETTRR
ncbi:hypothetical protein [Pseudogemmobacter humi]|uniref:DUF3618 domain-containing protein n=1 Tax=Pseudogemmobacter humi TaxID=2483812 RepID=A0A3P5X1M1_9RHOB|nr:hypothetical protein [Pseudogemmobacter humi]VDC28009.1 hypothetical protein XINFAN_01964 [Pseudogemmobacter humi]